MELYIPLRSRSLWSQEVRLPRDFQVVVCDNHSDSWYFANLLAQGAAIRSSPEIFDRLSFIDFCLKTFLGSSGEWLKWMIPGDYLYSSSAHILKQATDDYPEARLIISGYDLPDNQKRKKLKQTTILSPKETLRLLADDPDWFGAPLGQALHREALEDVVVGRSFETNWSRALCFEVASRFPTLYLEEAIGFYDEPCHLPAIKGEQAELESLLFTEEARTRCLLAGGEVGKRRKARK